MTKIIHHPSDETLLRYVSGGYDTGYNLVLATHLSVCAKCQKTVELQQLIGGHVLEEEKPANMNISASDLLRKADMPVVETPKPLGSTYSKKYGFEVPAILNSYVDGDFDGLKWQSLSPSIKQAVLTVDGKASARLLWMKPGHAVPAHGHSGEELTMILSGGYYDGDEAYTKGDLHCADHESPHMPTAMEDQPCIVLAATDSPLVFRGIIPRLLQPFFKI
ncbi:MAG: anti-sigma factor [Hyphomonadaceae bacterium]|nr:anti-sigma factor [Hyphomonadaceae bacterium]